MEKKIAKYVRLYDQINQLVAKTTNDIARMSTIAAVLHNKMNNFFWTGFYFIDNEQLVVGPYQGSLACLTLPKPNGVCWAAVLEEESIVVENVDKFPTHIACDSRSKSEIVVPIRRDGKIVAVLDVDSEKLSTFDQYDREGLEKICSLIYGE